MRIAICEDEASHARTLLQMVKAWAIQNQVHVDVCVYFSGEEFLESREGEGKFDLLLLDMQMKRIDGFSLAKIIRQTDNEMIIIFVTGLIDYVMRGYEVQALRYLTKPLKQADCFRALDKANAAVISRRKGLFFITDNGQSMRVYLNDIYYFTVEGRHVKAHTKEGEFAFRDRVRDLEERLPTPTFCRCGRTLIVNVAHVYLIEADQVELSNGEVLPLAHARWGALNEAFIAYHRRE